MSVEGPSRVQRIEALRALGRLVAGSKIEAVLASALAAEAAGASATCGAHGSSSHEPSAQTQSSPAAGDAGEAAPDGLRHRGETSSASSRHGEHHHHHHPHASSSHAKPSLPQEVAATDDAAYGAEMRPSLLQRYRLPAAWWYLTLDALSFGTWGSRCRRYTLIGHHRVLPYPRHAPASATRFLPILPPSPEFSARAYGSRLVLRRMEMLLGLFIGVNVFAWGVVIGGPSNPLFPVMGIQVEWMLAVVKAVSSGTQLRLACGFLAVLGALAFSGTLFALVAGRQGQARLLGVSARSGTVASVLPLIASRDAPFVMVSYTWRERYLHIARSLALALPDAWVDIGKLAAGENIERTIATTARHAHCLIILMAREYCQSIACCTELVSAALHRRPAEQVTLVYVVDDTLDPAEIEAALGPIGMQVVSSPRALLDMLSSHVYSCGTVADLQRLVRWYGRHGHVLRRLVREVRLPSPHVLRNQRRFRCWGARLRPPPGALCAGSEYLSADGLSRGRYVSLSFEAVALVLALGFWALSIGLIWTSYNTEAPAPSGPVMSFMTVVYTLLVFFILGSALPLHVDLDARNRHDPCLTPLNVAAFIADVGRSAFVASRSSGLSGAGGALLRPTSMAIVALTSLAAKAFSPGGGPGGAPGAGGDSAAGSPSSPGGAAAFLAAAGPEGLVPTLQRSLPSVRATPRRPDLQLSIAFVVPAAVDPHTSLLRTPLCPSAPDYCYTLLHERLARMVDFLSNVVGVPTFLATYERVDWEEELAEHGSRIYVIALTTTEAASHWVDELRPRIPASQCVLLIDWGVKDVAATREPGVTVGQHMSIVLGRRAGVTDGTPYDGLAPAVLDAIGVKIGPAVLSLGRRMQRLPPDASIGSAPLPDVLDRHNRERASRRRRIRHGGSGGGRNLGRRSSDVGGGAGGGSGGGGGLGSIADADVASDDELEDDDDSGEGPTPVAVTPRAGPGSFRGGTNSFRNLGSGVGGVGVTSTHGLAAAAASARALSAAAASARALSPGAVGAGVAASSRGLSPVASSVASSRALGRTGPMMTGPTVGVSSRGLSPSSSSSPARGPSFRVGNSGTGGSVVSGVPPSAQLQSHAGYPYHPVAFGLGSPMAPGGAVPSDAASFTFQMANPIRTAGGGGKGGRGGH